MSSSLSQPCLHSQILFLKLMDLLSVSKLNLFCLSNLFKHARPLICWSKHHFLFFFPPFYLNMVATCCLIQGQSAHLRFILEHRFLLASGADLSANADEHVAAANLGSWPFAPVGSNMRRLFLHLQLFFVFFLFFIMKICWSQSVFHQHLVSHWMDAAVHKSPWPWPKVTSSLTVLHTNILVLLFWGVSLFQGCCGFHWPFYKSKWLKILG